MQKIRLGPAGSPGKSTLEGVQMVNDMGLQAMEVEFVRGVHMGIDLAREVGALAKKLDIELSIHAPYYINLASAEKKKIQESKKRILDSVERGHYLGARYVVQVATPSSSSLLITLSCAFLQCLMASASESPADRSS